MGLSVGASLRERMDERILRDKVRELGDASAKKGRVARNEGRMEDAIFHDGELSRTIEILALIDDLDRGA